jgi:hypothetical protein
MALDKSLGKSKKTSSKKSSKKSKKHKLHHMHIEPTDNGGFIVHHSYDQPDSDSGEGPVPDQTHAIGNSDDLLSHVQDQFGGGSPAAGGGSPAPAAAGPGAPAAPPQGMQTGG